MGHTRVRARLHDSILSGGSVFDLADVAEAEEERDDADDAEAAVDCAPVGRNSADGAGDEGEWNDSDAGDDSELKNPLVAHGIAERAEKRDGDDEMSEGQPVRAVGHEGIVAVGIDDSVVNAAKPGMEGGFAGRRGRRGNMKDAVEHAGFALQREGGEAAQHQADDEERQPDANPVEERLATGSPGSGCEYLCHVDRLANKVRCRPRDQQFALARRKKLWLNRAHSRVPWVDVVVS